MIFSLFLLFQLFFVVTNHQRDSSSNSSNGDCVPTYHHDFGTSTNTEWWTAGWYGRKVTAGAGDVLASWAPIMFYYYYYFPYFSDISTDRSPPSLQMATPIFILFKYFYTRNKTTATSQPAGHQYHKSRRWSQPPPPTWTTTINRRLTYRGSR